VTDLLRHLRSWLRDQLDKLLELDRGLRHVWILIDVGIAGMIGMIEDGLIFPPQDWFKIDDLEIGEWLRNHGASRMAVESSLITELRQFLFSEAVGAGTGIHYTLRLVFTYKGAFSYKMQAGMGDTVFGPLYEVLEARGVKFEFFHRVDRLELSEDK